MAEDGTKTHSDLGRHSVEVRSRWSDEPGSAAIATGLLPALARCGIGLYLADPASDVGMPAGCACLTAPVPRMLDFTWGAAKPAANGETLVRYLVEELDLVPREAVSRLGAADLLLVPSRRDRAALRSAGVAAPVRVLHQGVDGMAFPVIEREPRFRFTFGTFGRLGERAGTDLLVRAFQDEFSRHEPVRLILHATRGDPWTGDLPPHAEPRHGVLDHSELLALLHELDVFVLPFRSEGAGVRGLEAMATGLPVIATDWSGPADYLDVADSFPLPCEVVPLGRTEGQPPPLLGERAEPSYEHLRQLMRHLYENPDAARSAGRGAAARVAVHWTWERAARRLAADLDLIAEGACPPPEETMGELGGVPDPGSPSR